MTATTLENKSPRSQVVQTPARFASLDALRGVVMFVMLFVNDIAGGPKLPAWLEHIHPSDANGMTMVDWVFGGFLFIVGVSIPPALAARRARGESILRLFAHVLLRTIGLLVLGVLMVNEDFDPKRLGWAVKLWETLLYVFAILAFVSPVHASPKGKRIGIVVRGIGFVGLAFLAVVFRNASGAMLTPQWWGILGQIGWAYLASATIYLLSFGNKIAIALAIPLLMSLFPLSRRGWFDDGAVGWINQYVDLGSMIGSQGAIAMAGVLLGAVIISTMPKKKQILFALCFGLVLLCAGFATRPAFGINKNDATPAWCFICAGVTCWLWAAIATITDLRGITRGLGLFIRGGQNVLLAYLLQPLWVYVIQLTGMQFYYRLGGTTASVITRGLVFSAIVLGIAGLLKDRIRLKL